MQAVFEIFRVDPRITIGYVQGEYSAKYVARKLGKDYSYTLLVLDDPDKLIKMNLDES